MSQDLLERIVTYAESIVDGQLLAGRKHIAACRRFLNDIARIPDDSFAYEFDGEELFKFDTWARMFRHREGVLVGQEISLTDFQLFTAANIFCWKHKVSGLRRFRKAYIQLARKNAKSQLLALIVSYSAFLSEEREEAYIAGWDREQSSIIYGQVLNQIEGCPMLKGKYTDSYGRITHLRSGSVIQPLSKEARKTGDGKNPSIAVLDEYHIHETSEIYDVLVSGMVARKNPLIVIITTAGFDLSRPCYTEYQYVSQILDESSPIENEEYFVMVCELDKDDDIKDESVWIKANPIVATYEQGMNSLRGELKSALDVPEKMRSFLTKNMDRWVDQKEDGYMSLDKWRMCGDTDLPDLTGIACYIGADLSMTTDLTSIGQVYPLADGRYFIRQRSFIPDDKLTERLHTDKVPYDLWVQQGWLFTTPGAIVDYSFVESYIMNLRDQGTVVHEVDFDKWNASHFAQDLEEEGFTMVEIPQAIRYLSEPTKQFRAAVLQGKIVHEKDPLLAWAIGNAVVKMDAQENVMLDKAKSKNRIDPIVAVINAFSRAKVIDNKVSVYEKRGMRRL